MKWSNMLIGYSAALVLITVVIVHAQSTPGEGPPIAQRRTIVASGSGTILTRPDSVRIYLGVVTESKTVSAAREENARAVAKVQDAVVALKLPDLKAKTRDTDVSIVKRRARRDLLDDDDGNQAIAGYRVSQAFSIVFQSNSVDELAAAAGRILDAALQNGVNEHGDVHFFLADDSGLQREAKTKAVEDAVANAKALAAGAHVKVIEVIEVEDSHRSSRNDFIMGSQGAISRRDTESGFAAGDWSITTNVRVVCRY